MLFYIIYSHKITRETLKKKEKRLYLIDDEFV